MSYKLGANPTRRCPYCLEPVSSMPPDSVDMCTEHGVVEGSTVVRPELD